MKDLEIILTYCEPLLDRKKTVVCYICEVLAGLLNISIPDEKKQRAGRLLLVGLTIITIAELAFLLVFVVEWKQARVEARRTLQQNVCVGMDTLTSCKGHVIDTKGIPKCCGEASVILDLLLKKYSREQMDEHFYPRLLTSEYCDARKGFPIAALRDINVIESRDNAHVVWDDTSHLSILRDVEHTTGRLRIIHSGYYFVHSQIKLNMSVSESVQSSRTQSSNYIHFVETPGTVIFYLYRYSNNHKSTRLLLESSETQCDGIGNVNYLTISIGSVFHLHKGDELFVVTTHPKNLASDYQGNYFGLYKI